MADPENGLDLETYPIPAPKELAAGWHEYVDDKAALMPAPGVDGVLAVPDIPFANIKAIASVDLCETMRHTGLALRTVEEWPPKTAAELDCFQHYAEGLFVRNNAQVVQTLMNQDLVQPVDGIDEIAAILRGWREHDVYTFANTSTLPGCELATLRFLGKYAAGGFQGIVFPRNHEGNLPLTKGIVARNVAELFGSSLRAAVHIDDLSVHNVKFREAMQELPDVTTATFQPVWPSCLPLDSASVQRATPLETFQAADEFLHRYIDN